MYALAKQSPFNIRSVRAISFTHRSHTTAKPRQRLFTNLLVYSTPAHPVNNSRPMAGNAAVRVSGLERQIPSDRAGIFRLGESLAIYAASSAMPGGSFPDPVRTCGSSICRLLYCHKLKGERFNTCPALRELSSLPQLQLFPQFLFMPKKNPPRKNPLKPA